MDTEAVGGAALAQLAQEQDFPAHFLHSHVVILHAREEALQVVELVIMGGEERLGALAVFVDVLHDAPGDGHAVEGGRASANLIQEHQRPGRQIIQDHGRLQHLHHEGGLSAGNVVRGAHTGEEFVEPADMGFPRRHKGPRLGHEHDEGRLPQQGALTGHVGASEDDDLLFFRIQIDVVGDIFFPGRHEGFNDGMPAFPDVQGLAVVHLGAAIVALYGLLGKACKHIHLGEDAAVHLDGGNLLLDAADELPVQAGLDGVDAVFGREDFLLVLFQLFGDIALRVHQGLLADPLRRNLVPIGVADFDIVTENIVVGYFEGTDAGAFGLPLLHLQEIILAAGAEGAEFVQFRIHARADDGALPHLDGRLRRQGPQDIGQELFAALEAAQQLSQGIRSLGEALLDGAREREAAAQLHHLAGIGPAVGDTAQDALQVSQLAQVHLGLLKNLRIFRKVLDGIETGAKLLQVHDGHGQPLPQQAGAHGAGAFVQRLDQGDAIGPGGTLEHLQVAEGELVHPHELGLVNTADGADVLEPAVLGLLQIHQEGPGAAHAQRVRVYGKALQAIDAHLAPQALHGGIVHEGPLVQGGGVNVS